MEDCLFVCEQPPDLENEIDASVLHRPSGNKRSKSDISFTYEIHYEKLSGEIKEECDSDEKNTASKELEIQDVNQNNESNYNCDICNKQFTLAANLNRHLIEFHSGRKSFLCELCSKEFRRNDHLLLHKKKKHDITEKRYLCECGKKYVTKSDLARHRKIFCKRKEVDPVRCACCNKSFRNQYLLKIHLRRASKSNRTFICDFCNKMFTYKCKLQWHIAKHMRACVCKEICTQKLLLGKELGKNTVCLCDNGKGKYVKDTNDFIDKSRASTKLICSSKRTGLKNYYCHRCNTSFDLKSQLQDHTCTVKQKNNSRFQCGECLKIYSRVCSLKRHVAEKHTEVKKYSCEICGKQYARLFECKLHEKNCVSIKKPIKRKGK